MAEAYITQSYSWNTGDTITAARLNGNITNIISGLQDGDKAINVLKVLGAGQQFITADGSDITLQNVDTYSGKDTITIHKPENDGNPSILIGAAAAERLEINTVFDSAAQTLDYVEFKTKAASATANKGKFIFSVDESNVLEINDSGLSLTGGLTLTSDITSTGAAIDWDLIDNNASALSFDSVGKAGIINIVTTNAAEGVTMSGTLGVTGATTLSSTLAVTGDVAVNTNKFNITAASGNTTIAGTLGVTGAITGPTATDTINGMIINAGAVSGVTTLTMSGDLTVDTNTLIVDSTNNRVGIGLTPSYKLHVKGVLNDAAILIQQSADASNLFYVSEDASGNGLMFLGDAAGAAKMFIDSDGDSYFNGGNVGIGTTTPDTLLNIEDTSAVPIFRMNASNTSGCQIQFGDTDDADVGRIVYDHSSNYMSFYTNATADQMIIDSSGNVGIGTSGPITLLDVTAADGVKDNDIVANFRNEEATAGRNFGVLIRAGSNSSDYSLRVVDKAATDLFRIVGDGNVGIGTANPDTILHLDDGNNTELTIEGANTGNSVIQFADSDSNNPGQLQYDHTADQLKIRAASAETAIVGASGLLVKVGGLDVGNNGTYLKFKVVEIGDWDMDATASVSVAHGVTGANIRSVQVIIRDDAGTGFKYLDYSDGSVNNSYTAGSWGWGATNFTLYRKPTLDFDNTSYDSTSYNRGWIMIWYE